MPRVVWNGIHSRNFAQRTLKTDRYIDHCSEASRSKFVSITADCADVFLLLLCVCVCVLVRHRLQVVRTYTWKKMKRRSIWKRCVEAELIITARPNGR